jgi:hypothetical protein
MVVKSVVEKCLDRSGDNCNRALPKKGTEFFAVSVFYHAAVEAKKICERKLLCKGIFKLVSVKVFT